MSMIRFAIVATSTFHLLYSCGSSRIKDTYDGRSGWSDMVYDRTKVY